MIQKGAIIVFIDKEKYGEYPDLFPPVGTKGVVRWMKENLIRVDWMILEPGKRMYARPYMVEELDSEKKITSFRDVPRFTSIGSNAADYPFPHFVDWVEKEEQEMGLQLTPDFQRGHVWTTVQQIAYLEFFLKGGKTGRDIYLNDPSANIDVGESAYNEYVCVDGLQRITAFKRFVHDEIPVFGSYFSEFEDKPNLTLHTVRVHINDLKSKKEVLKWYIEMNEGGTPHSAKEIERVKKMYTEEM